MKWGPVPEAERVLVIFPAGHGKDRREYAGCNAVRIHDKRPVRVFNVELTDDKTTLRVELSEEPAKIEKIGQRLIFIIGKA